MRLRLFHKSQFNTQIGYVKEWSYQKYELQKYRHLWRSFLGYKTASTREMQILLFLKERELYVTDD